MLDRAAFVRPYAHRGLHDASMGIIENTGPAFEAAIARSCGIECDLRPAAGGLPLVFHDETIDRLIEGHGPVAAVTAGQIARLRYKGGPGTSLLTFAGLLELVAGRAPILAEAKSEWDPPDERFLAAIAELAAAYKGPLALMSFDPAVVAALKRLAPRVPRGIVSGSYFDDEGKGWWPGKLTDARRTALANLEESAAADPCFYAYDVRALPTPAVRHARETLGLPIFTWTVRTDRDRRIAAAHADAVIFEGFEP